jgi:hypothetical protein
MKKKILRALRLDKISGVDRPAQEPATVAVIIKSDNPEAEEAEMNEEVEKNDEVEEILSEFVEPEAEVEKNDEAEEAPAEEPVAEEAPEEEPAAEEAPEEAPAEEEPAVEEAPVEEAPVEKAEASVIYKSLDGTEYGSDDDPRLIEAVKRADALETEKVEIAKAAEEVALAKRAEETLGNCPGSEDVKKGLLRAVESLGDDVRDGALEILKAANENLAGAFEERGTADGGPAEELSFGEAYENLAKSFAETNNISVDEARLKVTYTNEFAELYNNQGR